MTFISIAFAIFLPVFLLLYFLCPSKYRYIVVLAGSYFFYAFSDFKMIFVLLGVTISTYLGGFLIGKYRKKSLLWVFFGINILILAVFKYTNFLIENINAVALKLHLMNEPIGALSIIIPVGLSFMIFQSCTYLTDVYKEKIEPEKNFFLYASFVAFFPCILSGPIQKSRELIPQLKNPKKIDGDTLKKGTLLFTWGFFEKVMISNQLISIINTAFDDCINTNPALNLAAAVLFSIYIYADFASYSDMARGISLVLGIDVGKNFDNPYLSQSTSEFWNRWHMSLNSWFLENVYIPLGGNRKGEFRKYVNLMVVFFISGLWHGASNHFVVWGVLNGLFVIAGRLLLPVKKSCYKKLNIDEDLESMVFLRRLIVFMIITFTWIFFKNGFTQSVEIIKSIAHVTLLDFFRDDFVGMAGNTRHTISMILALFTFYKIQMNRQNESKFYERINKQPVIIQAILFAILIYICFFAVCGTNKYVNTDFVYFQF